MYEFDSHCPCCAAPLVATVTVEDTGGDPQHGHSYDVSLELRGPEPVEGHNPATCKVCKSPFLTEGERLECEAPMRAFLENYLATKRAP